METKKDYKDTLLMPQTDFSMKANLAEKEKQFIKNWEESKLYQRLLKKNKSNKPFILHDGPPYANGNIHLGHALNKIIKDIIVRFRTMQGFFSPYVAGWDTHGLPIEHKMLSEAKKAAKDYSIVELRKAAHQYALSQIELQKEQFKKLAVLTDFQDIYVTLDKELEAKQLELFKKEILSGLIYKDLKPVYWSPSSQSALAEAEVEYSDHVSPSIYVAFELQNNKIFPKNTSLLIWTTTPWTLLANAAVAINEKFNYSLIEVKNRNFIIASELVETVASEGKWENWKILKTFKGKELLSLNYLSPLNKNICPVVLGHHVTLESGTGLVHIAPLFGEDDFIIGQKNALNSIMHVEDDGTLNKHGLQWAGIFYDDANPKIGQYLEANGNLIIFKKIKHQYPHDWRTHKPIIYRATPQWFVSLKSIKSNLTDALKEVKTYNEWSKKRLLNMLENRESWCISRQRSWGVPIIVFYDKNKQPVLEEEIFDHVIDLVRKYGSDIWYEKSADELLPKKYQGKGFVKEQDIMDVWFDSGSTSISVKPGNVEAPFDLYFEGSDQYRGWFNSSLINSVIWRNKAPFKALLSHGFLLDGKGNKMSKSKGNVIDPLDITNKYGADILRLWVANSEYTNDISIDDKILQQNIEIYRKFRNTMKFILGSISDYDWSEVKLSSIHELMFNRLQNLTNKIIEAYEDYRFVAVIKLINNFVINLSSYYLSIVKDILYLNKQNDSERRQVQFVLASIAKVLTIAFAPIMPSTCEEIYSYLNIPNKLSSIHEEEFPKLSTPNEKLEEKWEEFFLLKDEVYKAIEEKIQLQLMKRQNEAHVTLKTPSDFIKSLDLTKLLMVAKVTFGSEFKVEKLVSYKCLRCWNHFERANFDFDLELCQRCKEVVNEQTN